MSEQYLPHPIPNIAGVSPDTDGQVVPAHCDEGKHISGAAVDAAILDTRDQAVTPSAASRSPRRAEQDNGDSISRDLPHGKNQNENRRHADDSRAGHGQNRPLVRAPFREVQNGAISLAGKSGMLPGNSLIVHSCTGHLCALLLLGWLTCK